MLKSIKILLTLYLLIKQIKLLYFVWFWTWGKINIVVPPPPMALQPKSGPGLHQSLPPIHSIPVSYTHLDVYKRQLCAQCHTCKKKIITIIIIVIIFNLDMFMPPFFGQRLLHVPFPTLSFHLEIILEHLRFIFLLLIYPKNWLNFESSQQILTTFQLFSL